LGLVFTSARHPKRGLSPIPPNSCHPEGTRGSGADWARVEGPLQYQPIGAATGSSFANSQRTTGFSQRGGKRHVYSTVAHPLAFTLRQITSTPYQEGNFNARETLSSPRQHIFQLIHKYFSW